METQTKTARPATLGLFKTVEKLFNYFNPDGKKVFERIFIGKEFDGFILSKKLGFLSNDKDILHLIDPEIFKNGNSIQAPATISFINGEINVFYSFLYDPHFESVDYSFFPSVEWCILNEKVAKTEKIIAWKLWQPL